MDELVNEINILLEAAELDTCTVADTNNDGAIDRIDLTVCSKAFHNSK